METIRKGTQKARAMIEAYRNAYMTSLYEAYPSGHSYAKKRAFDYCQNLRDKMGGYGLAITSKNTFQFTAAFLYEDATTGETMLCFITKAHDYATPYDA